MNVTDNSMRHLTDLNSRNKCRECQRAIADGEPVGSWRKYVHEWEHKMVCMECINASESSDVFEDQGPCCVCSRKVYTYGEPAHNRLYIVCGSACEKARVVKLNKDRRHKNRATIDCERCRTPFVQVRTDARYCSSKCRQASYRNRLATAGGAK